MEQLSPTRVEQYPADLQVLYRQLEEMAARARKADHPNSDYHRYAEGPILVIRGK